MILSHSNLALVGETELNINLGKTVFRCHVLYNCITLHGAKKAYKQIAHYVALAAI
jgi:hypothetical protein